MIIKRKNDVTSKAFHLRSPSVRFLIFIMSMFSHSSEQEKAAVFRQTSRLYNRFEALRKV